MNWKNETVFITGINGTFGTAMVERLLKLGVSKIVGVNRHEESQAKSKQKFHNDSRITYYIGDIRNKELMEDIFRIEQPTVVMLAGAMKHIDLCEKNPDECIDINVNAHKELIKLSIRRGVEKLVFLSTDKATSPTTIYGTSKLIIEQFIDSVYSSDTTLIKTRYGNVLGSNGSVLDIWKRQRDNGEALTVTNPDITRFFMSIDQAVDLVLYALENGEDKDLWVYNNKSCTIGELASCISDNQIITGLRCIEKTDEALLTTNERNHSEIYCGEYIRSAKDIDNAIKGESLDGGKFDIKQFHTPLTSDNAERFTRDEILELINNIK